MKLLTAAAFLMVVISAKTIGNSQTTTETLTRLVFTCPCDSSSWTSTVVSEISSDEKSQPTNTGSVRTSHGYSNITTTSIPTTGISTTTLILTTTSATSLTSTNPVTTTTNEPASTSTTASSTPTSTTTYPPTSTFYIAVSTGSPASRKRQTSTEYLSFDADGQSSLVDTEAEATILTVDVDGNLITDANPTQYVACSSTAPTVLILQDTAPTPQVSVTFNSDGSLSINGIASQCELNDQLVVSTDGTTPDGCTPVNLAADNGAGEGSTTTSAVQYTTSCTTSTSTTVFAPGSTGTNVAVACSAQPVTSTSAAIVSFVSGCTTSSSTTVFADGSTGTNVAVACSKSAVTLS